MTSKIKFIFKYAYALLASSYLFTLGVFQKKHRTFIEGIYSHFHWKKAPALPKKVLPVVSSESLFQNKDSVEIIEAEERDGNISLKETVVIAKLLKEYQPEQVFEFGTFDGRTTVHLAANTGQGARIHTLDLPAQEKQETAFDLNPAERKYAEKKVVGGRYHQSPHAQKINQLYGDSASFDFEPYKNSVDFVFIDASHTYDYVKQDSETALYLLRDKKGIILWHDYTPWWEGVVRALNELYKEDARFSKLQHIEDTSLAYLRMD